MTWSDARAANALDTIDSVVSRDDMGRSTHARQPAGCKADSPRVLVSDAEPDSNRTDERRVRVSDKPFEMAVHDPSAGTWRLHVAHSGEAALMLDGDQVATLSHRCGAALLHAEACPFERAAELIGDVAARSVLAIGSATRMELEFGLARWIPLYFDL